mgnify:CR=1 FL=1
MWVDALRLAAAQQGIILSIARFQQWEGYLEALPLGRAELGLLHDTSGQAVAMGLPTATPGLRSRGGLPLVWGEHPRTGAPLEVESPLAWDLAAFLAAQR